MLTRKERIWTAVVAICLIALIVMAANPTFNSFNPAQFTTTGDIISIKPGSGGGGNVFTPQFGSNADGIYIAPGYRTTNSAIVGTTQYLPSGEEIGDGTGAQTGDGILWNPSTGNWYLSFLSYGDQLGSIFGATGNYSVGVTAPNIIVSNGVPGTATNALTSSSIAMTNSGTNVFTVNTNAGVAIGGNLTATNLSPGFAHTTNINLIDGTAVSTTITTGYSGTPSYVRLVLYCSTNDSNSGMVVGQELDTYATTETGVAVSSVRGCPFSAISTPTTIIITYAGIQGSMIIATPPSALSQAFFTSMNNFQLKCYYGQ